MWLCYCKANRQKCANIVVGGHLGFWVRDDHECLPLAYILWGDVISVDNAELWKSWFVLIISCWTPCEAVDVGEMALSELFHSECDEWRWGASMNHQSNMPRMPSHYFQKDSVNWWSLWQVIVRKLNSRWPPYPISGYLVVGSPQKSKWTFSCASPLYNKKY
jgi:hypothetical protein